MFLSAAAAAEAGPLQGRVSGAGAGVPSALVEVLDGAGNPIAGANALTDVNGDYSIPIADGTYDVRVTPPATSGFGAATASNVNVSGATTLNFVLASSAQAVLAGRLLDADGLGIPSQTLLLLPDGGEGVEFATSDAGGYFRFEVAPGAYRLHIEGSNQNFTVGAPQFYSLQTEVIAVSGNQTTDYRLPAHRVSVHVQDASSNGVANVGFSTSPLFNCGFSFGATTACGFSYYSFDAGAPPPPAGVTDTNGNQTLFLFATPPPPDSYSITAVPPASSGFGPTTVSGIQVAGNTSVTITLSATLRLSGRLTDAAGVAAPNQLIELFIEGTGLQYATSTGANGEYSFEVQPGNYRLSVAGDNQSFTLSAPQFYRLFSDVFSLSADRTIDITVPAVQVDVHVQKADSSAAAGVGISASAVVNCGLSLSTSSGLSACGISNYSFSPGFGETTNSAGDVTLWLFPTTPATATYTFTAIPTLGGGAQTTVSNVQIPGSTSLTITLVAARRLSGRLLGGNQVPIPFQQISLISDASPPMAAITDESGAYTLEVMSGTYRLSVLGDNQNFGVNAPGFFSLVGAPFDITTDMVVDLQLPVKAVTVQVKDGAGTAVPNAGVSTTAVPNCALPFGPTTACGSSSYFYLAPALGEPPPAVGVTNSSGELTLWLFPTPTTDPPTPGYSLTAIPMPGTGLTSTTATDQSITTNTTILITLGGTTHDAPQTTHTFTQGDNGDGTFSDPVTIALSATAAAGFTVENTFYAVDGGPDQTYTGPITIAGNGEHTLTYFSVDNGGVAEARQSLTFRIGHPDQTPPVTTATITPDPGPSGWWSEPVTIVLQADDGDEGSGVAEIRYTVGSNAEVVVAGSTATVVVATNGITQVQFYAVDVAGNVETPQTVTIQIDTAAPLVEITSPTAATIAHTDTFTVSWTVESTSPITSESATLDGSPVTNGQSINALTLPLGPHTLTVTATNLAGLTGTATKTFAIIATFDSLGAAVQQLCGQGLISNAGICRSLLAKIESAAAAHARGNDNAASATLNALLKELAAQRGKSITEAAYALLRADVLYVLGTLP